MKGQKRIRDYGITVGKMKTGAMNAITDVKGVKVGHATLNDGNIKTGVTAILPHEGNLFKEKVIAASHVINGFGKSIGIIQIKEMGTIETPIILTNTLSVGTAADALIEYMLERNQDIGVTTGTVNPVVGECNDGYLNDIRGKHVKRVHIFEALEKADIEFFEGAVGAGTGMSCYHLKGGIGSASRIIEVYPQKYTVGVLVLSNFGQKEDLIIDGIKAGKIINELSSSNEKDQGSIIIIIATDIPVTERQLNRITKRAVVGLNRTGSYIGNGSGDIVIAFTTANKVKHDDTELITPVMMLNENSMDLVFRSVVEATEEAILNSLICAETTIGRDGNKRISLKEYIKEILKRK